MGELRFVEQGNVEGKIQLTGGEFTGQVAALHRVALHINAGGMLLQMGHKQGQQIGLGGIVHGKRKAPLRGGGVKVIVLGQTVFQIR